MRRHREQLLQQIPSKFGWDPHPTCVKGHVRVCEFNNKLALWDGNQWCEFEKLESPQSGTQRGSIG